jgi:hypothetical protein
VEPVPDPLLRRNRTRDLWVSSQATQSLSSVFVRRLIVYLTLKHFAKWQYGDYEVASCLWSHPWCATYKGCTVEGQTVTHRPTRLCDPCRMNSNKSTCFCAYNTMRTYREVAVQLYHSSSLHWMEVSKHLQVPTVLLLIRFGQEAKCVPNTVWSLSKSENLLTTPGTEPRPSTL